MEPHDSKPYNPDIARVFYRAGFIENWGQGIQKICNECRAIGAEIPTYELIGTTLRIQFKALQSALIDHSKAQKHQSSKNNGALENEMMLNIVTIIRSDPTISQDAIVQALGTTRRIVQKYINLLK